MVSAPPQSAAASIARAWLGFTLLLLAHFAVRPLLDTRANVDYLLIGVLFAAVRTRPGLAAVIGLLAGLCVDALVPMAFGAASLAYVVVAFLASRVKAVFFADHVALTGLFVVVGKVVFDILYISTSGGLRGTALGMQLLLWTPVSAALTALVAIVLLTLFRPLYRPGA
ncbi:MAG: rod shape-determining protein MreD [Gemmatimonadaceae bacterium]|nr:rod shape-determining protein MreD [Gemmatimonadaceae bacterium]